MKTLPPGARLYVGGMIALGAVLLVVCFPVETLRTPWLFLLLLTLSLPQAVESFALYRSYFWQMTAIGTLVLVARHVALTKSDLDWRRDLDLVAIAVLATAASIGVHYVGALFGGLLASAIAVCACSSSPASRRRRRAGQPSSITSGSTCQVLPRSACWPHLR